MKKLLLVSLLLLLLVSQVSGIALTFQNSGDFASYVTCVGGGSCSWVDNSGSCGNSYLYVFSGTGFVSHYIKNVDANPTSYAAATLVTGTWNVGFGHGSIRLYDSVGATLATFDLGNTVTPGARYEVKVSGGTATVYKNGVSVSSAAVTQNPSYVGWGAVSDNAATSGESMWDDIVMGNDETGLIFSAPAEGCYLRRDPIGGGSGLYNAANTLINTYNMSTTWAKKSDGTSINVVMQNWGTGVNVNSFATGTSAISGTKSWPIADDITDTYNYGYYVVKTDPVVVGVYSDVIPYKMGGAVALWDRDQYSRNDLAGITVSISDGTPDYWDTGVYSYSLKISDLYGTVKQTTTITSASQFVTYQFSESADDMGVYVAALYMTRISDGVQFLMSQDLATVNGYVRLEIYAYNSSAQTPLSSVHVNITQSSYYDVSYTSAIGYTNTSASVPFGTGSMLTANLTKAGFRQRYIQFIPQSAKTINMTVPLEPLVRAHTGIIIHGLNVDNVYSNPVPSPIVLAYNTTYGQNFSVNANALGDYVFEDGVGTVLTSGVCYHIRSVKADYTFISPTSPKCVYGV